MMKKLALSLGTVSLFLTSSGAWAVPVDSLQCMFVVKDSLNRILLNTAMNFDVGRKVQLSNTGFKETWGRFKYLGAVPASLRFGFELSYRHATDGNVGLQKGSVGYVWCNDSSGEKCMGTGAPVPGPDDQPYFGWRQVSVVDGVPQLDLTEMFPEPWPRVNHPQIVEIENKKYRLFLSCVDTKVQH